MGPDERAQLELLLRRIDEMRADVARMLGSDRNAADDDGDEEIIQLAAERAARMKRRRTGGV